MAKPKRPNATSPVAGGTAVKREDGGTSGGGDRKSGGKPKAMSQARSAVAALESADMSSHVRKTGPCADHLSFGEAFFEMLEECASMLVVSLIWAGCLCCLRYWTGSSLELIAVVYALTTGIAWTLNFMLIMVMPEWSITGWLLTSGAPSPINKRRKSVGVGVAAAEPVPVLKLSEWAHTHAFRSIGWTLVLIYVVAVSCSDSDLLTEKQRQSFGEQLSAPTLMWSAFIGTLILFLLTLREYHFPRLLATPEQAAAVAAAGGDSEDDEYEANFFDVRPWYEVAWRFKIYVIGYAGIACYFLTVMNTLFSVPTAAPSVWVNEDLTRPLYLALMWLFTAAIVIKTANMLVCPRFVKKFTIEPLPGRASPLPFGTKLAMIAVALLFFLKVPRDMWLEHSCAVPLYRFHSHENTYPIVTHEFERMAHRLAESAAPQYDFKPYSNSSSARSAFPKAHGCVRAKFRVSDRLAPGDKIGLFRHSGVEYDAWVRFSNGALRAADDDVRDVRGMSIKLMNVPGTKLTATLTQELKDAHKRAGVAAVAAEANSGAAAPFHDYETAIETMTHDLLLSTGEVFPIADPALYGRLMAGLSDRTSSWTLLSLMYPSWNPLTWLPALRWNLGRWFHGGDVTSPLTATYYSQTPYRFGTTGPTHAVKYMVQPCEINHSGSPKSRVGGNFLRENMRKRLDPASASADACFDLFVQRQEEPCTQPIDDPTQPWSSAYVQLGTLTIPRQLFLARDQIEFCDRLTFNPWQALPEHAPLGAINNARAISYLVGAQSRHRQTTSNGGAAHREPNGAEVFTKSQLPEPYRGAGAVTQYEYASYAAPFEHLPKHVKNFPSFEAFDTAKFAKLSINLIVTNWFSSGMHELNGGEGSIKDFIVSKGDSAVPEDYASLVNREFATAYVSGSNWTVDTLWRQDSEWARQFISGVHTLAIRVATQPNAQPIANPIPAAFQPNETEIARMKAIAGGLSLDELIAAKRLFFADYSVLEGITMVPGRFFYIPITLLFLKDMGPNVPRQLMPLAIQLTRNAHEHNRVFTPPPADTPSDSNAALVWLFVKMHASCADGQVHQSISHLGMTHLSLEPILIGFHRQLNENHPLLKLLRPHFVDTLAINDLGRSTLLAMGSHSDFQRVTAMGLIGTEQLMEKAYQNSWDAHTWRFPDELRLRGFEEVTNPNDDVLPGYRFRDFGFKIWNAMHKFVAALIKSHYGTDSGVLADREVQSLVEELYDPDMGALPGRPLVLDSLASLTDFVTSVMFTASAGHSVVNFGQYDYYSFIPNRPLFLSRLLPTDTNLVDMPYIMRALPNVDTAEETIVLARTLTYMEQNGLLDAYRAGGAGAKKGAGAAADPNAPSAAFASVYDLNPSAYKVFVAELERIEKEIHTTNEQQKVYFPYLSPTYIMPSISI